MNRKGWSTVLKSFLVWEILSGAIQSVLTGQQQVKRKMRLRGQKPLKLLHLLSFIHLIILLWKINFSQIDEGVFLSMKNVGRQTIETITQTTKTSQPNPEPVLSC